MRFGIIMPTYQRPTLLKRAIESVLAQTHEDWVLVVADDGSGDDTEKVIRSYRDQEKRIIASPGKENLGVNAARNRALELLLMRDDVHVLTLLDDDDYFLPETLQNAALQFECHPEEEWLLTGCEVNIEKPTALRKTGKVDYVNGYLWGRKIKGDVTHFIRREAIGETRFTRVLKQAEEWTFFLGLSRYCQPFVYSGVGTVKEYNPTGLLGSRPNRELGRSLRMSQASLALRLRPWNLRARKYAIKLGLKGVRPLALDVLDRYGEEI
jgi:glycosyltransferase involved in cell wall biosynthesis